jgi:hypothetical protein
MWLWIKHIWARTGLWIKLAGLAAFSLLGYITYIQLKRRGLEREADNLRRENTIKSAEVKVAFLEGQKQRNRARLAQIPNEEVKIDEKIVAEKKKAEEARARIEGMTDEQIAARFRELGF